MEGGSSKGVKHEAPKSEQQSGAIEQQDGRTSKRIRAESHVVLVQQASEYYDAEADEDDVRTEVTTGDGKTHKNTLPHTSTVLVLKQHLAHDAGFKPGQTRMFVNDNSREEELEVEERLGRLRRGKGLAVAITMMVEEADAQEVVPRLAAAADLVLGDGQLSWLEDYYDYLGVAYVPSRPDWVVTTEAYENCVKISNIRTGALICKFAEEGMGTWGVAVTSDSSFVITADFDCHRITVLRLVVAADSSSGKLKFVRRIGAVARRKAEARTCRGARSAFTGGGSGEGQLNSPSGVALLPGEGGRQETVLVTDDSHRVSQFKLDGTFIRIFAGTGQRGSGNGEFNHPRGITVLGSSGEVAVADRNNHRVQIFDREGNYKRQFGSKEADGSYGEEADGQFGCPSALAFDAHGNLLVLDLSNRLQVFSPEGKHLCTRNDLGLKKNASKGIAWSDVGELAVANGHQALLWRNM
jgi:DNA-binding beta-propeller fold protein YncE